MQNFTDETFAEQTSAKRDALIPVTIFISLEITVGFLGNLAILYVFLLKYHKCSYRYFVISLASYDLIGTMTTMPAEIVQHRYWHEYPSDAICKAKSFCVILTVGGNCLTLLVISIDRYRRVCRPLSWQFKPRQARLLCLLVLTGAIVLSVPIPIYRGTNTAEVQGNNKTFHFTVCDGDDEYDGSDIRLYITVPLIIILGSCLSTMFVLYSIIVIKLLVGKNKILQSGGHAMVLKTETSSKSNSEGSHNAKLESIESSDTTAQCNDTAKCNLSDPERKGLGQTRSTHAYDSSTKYDGLRKRTFLMFILTATFFTTTVLYLVLISFAMVTDNTMYAMTTTTLPVYLFFLRLVFINHVINPFVYGFLDPEFRHLFIQGFTVCKRILPV